MVTEHPWQLAGPWYRWAHPGVIADGRVSAPAIQKFASDDFVNEFLKQPQHSLKFDPQVDVVQNIHFESVVLGTALAGKRGSLYPGDANNLPAKPVLVPTSRRKLFLDTHSRHYLVVCELHCDVPGFPNAIAGAVCQAGFVVRRRYLSYPIEAAPQAKALVKTIIQLQATLADLDQTAPLRPRAAKRRAENIQKMIAQGTFGVARQTALDNLATVQAELNQWGQVNGAHHVLQGWVAGAHQRIGAWRVVEDEPQDLVEATFPLYPVFAGPAQTDHDAYGRAFYFGVIPTSSFDIDATGAARFDDRSAYEIRCFVRRHIPGCPRTLPPPDCHGALTWSESTETYQLASHFDLEGTSNRPITIQMPNLAELAAQAAALPLGKYSPVKVIHSQAMNPPKDPLSAGAGALLGGAQICFFSIPLITIIAMFVLNIFLPVVILIFNLWFLLAFKFCIPPSVAAAGGAQADITALGPNVDLNADFSVNVAVNGVNTHLTTDSVNQALETDVDSDFTANNPSLGGKVNTLKLANSPLNDLNKINVDLAAAPNVDPAGSLQFETVVPPPARA